MKRFLVLIIGLLACAIGWADDVEFIASAPSSVVAGQQFRLSFIVNKEGKNFQSPEIADFEVLYGPSTSHSSSFSVVNGKASKSMTITYTYALVGTKPGTYTIGPASITVSGQNYTTTPITIKVLPPDSNTSANQGVAGQSQSSNQQSLGEVSNESVFVRTILSKQRAYEQEAVLVTYKLYCRADVRDIASAKFPEYQGFYTQDIDLDQNRSWTVENYNGTNYKTLLLKQSLLFAQHAGTLEIPSGKMDVVVQVRNQSRQPGFFGGYFDTYQNVQKTVVIPAASIEIKALPSGAPAGFGGAVGSFKMSSEINSTEVSVNDPVNVKVNITGTGNLKLIKTPEIVFPNDFDVYDPKTNANTRVAVSGISGTKTVEYLAIPRYGGDFEIPSAEFCYFDLDTKQYKTLKTEAYHLNVSGTAADNQTPVVGQTPVAVKEDVKHLGSDIRYIHNGKQPKQGQRFFFGSVGFWLALLIPLLAFVLLLILLRQRAKENANVALRNNKRANKLARKRLKNAEKFLKAGDSTHFYEETMRALWGYLSDKLTIPVAELTKDNVRQEMIRHQATEQQCSAVLDAISECEFARFSPNSGEEVSMHRLYDRAVELITDLDNTLKRPI
ncbi:MAG: protein BatD [Paludibacteraceae bacterium]|nr:protein BatD [Paludibacteraceae bacterium]